MTRRILLFCLNIALISWYLIDFDIKIFASQFSIFNIDDKYVALFGVMLSIIMNIENLIDYNKKILNLEKIFISALIIISAFTIVLIYPKLVYKTFIHETTRIDLLLAILIGVIFAFLCMGISFAVKMNIKQYKDNNMIPFGHKMALMQSIAYNAVFYVAFYFFVMDKSFSVLMYYEMIVAFIAISILMIDSYDLNNSNFIENVSDLLKWRSRQIYLIRSARQNKDVDYIDGKKRHKKVMNKIKKMNKNHGFSHTHIVMQQQIQYEILNGKIILEHINNSEPVIQTQINIDRNIINLSINYKHIYDAVTYINNNNVEIKNPLERIVQFGIFAAISENPDQDLLVNYTNSIPLFFYKKIISNNKIDINIQNKYNGYTALALAVANGYIDKTELLLSKGADTNIKNNAGISPLHFAASYGNVKLCELLLIYGADINILHTAYRHTPLIIASSRGHAPVVKFLLSHNADSTIKDIYGLTALDHARGNKFGIIVKMLLRYNSSEKDIK